MCGNLSKHNFTRAGRVAEKLKDILVNRGISITIEDALLALPGFYERFHKDILNYHGSTIAEFLNNIRWGIYEYLQPEFKRSIEYYGDDNPQKYHFLYPDGMNSEFAKKCYWDLMNEMRSKPFMRRFVVSQSLKGSY